MSSPYADDDICHCGLEMDQHTAWDNHAPVLLEQAPLDPKPWRCTSCSDRFVREPGIDAPTSHVTKFLPREGYAQLRSSYR